MTFRDFRQTRLPAVILSTMVATLFAGVAGTASGASGGACPGIGSLGDFLAASNVAATFSNAGTTTTYTFKSLTNENPVGGVPGLVKYCVYPNPATAMPPDPMTVLATGANGDLWKSNTGSDSFSFVRPGGNKSNIPLNGTTTVMGTATWTDLPSAQTILLHISDPTVCNTLYGGDPGTCFVKPKPGPICNAGTGNTNAAYNAIPTDVMHCSPPSLGFEATQTNEFGDEVTLDTTGGTKLVSMTVDFQSYGCGDSGHWNTGATEPCVTTAGETFSVPGGITAKIYDPSDLVNALATATINPSIPFRPSADPTNCPGVGSQGSNDVGSRWFDSVSGACNYSLSVPLTFTFPSGQQPTFTNGQHVVWTVQFNTTHYGYNPIGQAASCFSVAAGCGYDSLNVGAKSYLNAPYAGTDVDEDVAFRSIGILSLQSETGWTGYRPLGQIVLGP